MGSIANLIVAEKSKSASKKHELTFLQHLKFCLWSTPLIILVGCVVLQLVVRIYA